MAEDIPDGLLRESLLYPASQVHLSWSVLRSVDQEARAAGSEGTTEDGDHREHV